MFDFRYHALSLGAVFLALAIGILLGVTIGDSLVSDVDRGLRADLREDVSRANRERDEAREQNRRADELAREALPILTRDRLAGQTVALVSSGEIPEQVENSVREAVETAGGDLDSVSVLVIPAEVTDLQNALGRSFAGRSPSSDLLERMGLRVARSLVVGGPTAGRLARARPERFQGDFESADAVVFFRAPPEEGVEERGREFFEDGLIEGFARSNIPVVGVETADADESQVGWYADHDLSSSDYVDQPGGRMALVLALRGVDGNYGFKDGSDDGPLPDADDVP